MLMRKFGHYYVLRLHKNDEIITVLKEAAENYKINGAFFFGLGVGSSVVLGYFDVDRRTYIKKAFEGEYEFTSFSGNIAKYNGDVVIHCHVTIADKNFDAVGGHLIQATVPATCEIIIFPFTGMLKRKRDRDTHLAVLDV
jgi:predicted DNA-binding protein with PD1-like motif